MPSTRPPSSRRPISAASSPTSTTSSARSPSTQPRRAARTGPSDRQLRLPPEGVHPRPVADDRARPGLARRAPQPREGRHASTGSTPPSCRSSTDAASPASTSRSAATSPQRKEAEAQLREQAALPQLGQLDGHGRARSPQPPGRACVARCRSSTGASSASIGPRRHRDDDPADRRAERQGRRPAAVRQAHRGAVRPRRRAALAREVAASVRGGNGQRGPDDCGARWPVRARAAIRTTLRAALLNLTMNACQASADGERRDRGHGREDGSCRMAVRDRGPGLPQTFASGCSSRSSRRGRKAPGLGLAIVKRLVEQQGGRIALTDRPGGGTVATVSLPLAAVS